MSPGQVEIIRRTWSDLAPRAEALSVDFYARLFELAPDAERLLAPLDMTVQRRKFVATVDALVRAADDPGALVSASVPHGRRHARLGATEAHFTAAGSALLQSLDAALGDGFTHDAHDAWSDLYALVSAVMRRAGQPKRTGAAATGAIHPPS